MALSESSPFSRRTRSRLAALLVVASLLSACSGSPKGATPSAQSPAAGKAPTTTSAATPFVPPTAPPSTPTSALKASPTTATSAASAQAGQVDPCSLASPTAIQSTLGVSVSGNGTSANGGCDWKLANGSRLHVQDYGVAGKQSYQAMFVALCGGANKDTNHCVPVAGLGKQATFEEDALDKVIIGRSVLIRLPDDIVDVEQLKADSRSLAGKDALIGLARIVAGHRS